MQPRPCPQSSQGLRRDTIRDLALVKPPLQPNLVLAGQLLVVRLPLPLVAQQVEGISQLREGPLRPRVLCLVGVDAFGEAPVRVLELAFVRSSPHLEQLVPRLLARAVGFERRMGCAAATTGRAAPRSRAHHSPRHAERAAVAWRPAARLRGSVLKLAQPTRTRSASLAGRPSLPSPGSADWLAARQVSHSAGSLPRVASAWHLTGAASRHSGVAAA